MLTNIHQIYFDDQSRKNCFEEWSLYNNSGKLTEFFENSVIVELIKKGEHKKTEYFGVFSHKVKKRVFKQDGMMFNPANLEKVISNNQYIDVFSFNARRKQGNIIKQAENYHKGFIAIIEKILERTGFMDAIPDKLPEIVLFNLFIARSGIYEQYVKELLIPAMDILKDLPEAYKDAKYRRLDPETKERFKKGFGLTHYPYHPFICERLFSVFMTKYNYSFKHIF